MFTILACLIFSATSVPIAESFVFPVSPYNSYHIEYGQTFMGLSTTIGKYHMGEDLNFGQGNDDLGKPVFSVANGIVVRVDDTNEMNSWGKVLVVAHTLPNNQIVYSIYAHLQKILVNKAEVVSKGQKIAKIGNANGYYVDGAHLHFAIKKRRPFPPSPGSNPYVYPLGVDDPTDYYCPSLFVANRNNPVATYLTLWQWVVVSVPDFSPIATAFVRVDHPGSLSYYTISDAIKNGVLKNKVRETMPNGQTIDTSFGFTIFDPRVTYRFYAKTTGVSITLFPQQSEFWDKQALQDLVWVARSSGIVLYIKPETLNSWPTVLWGNTPVLASSMKVVLLNGLESSFVDARIIDNPLIRGYGLLENINSLSSVIGGDHVD